MDFSEVLPYFWLALPLLIALIMAQRYNFLLGFTTYFAFSYLIYFVVMKTPIINGEMALSSGAYEACEFLYDNVITPFRHVFEICLYQLGIDGISGLNVILSTSYGYLFFFILLQIALQIFSSIQRNKKIRENRQLRV